MKSDEVIKSGVSAAVASWTEERLIGVIRATKATIDGTGAAIVNAKMKERNMTGDPVAAAKKLLPVLEAALRNKQGAK